MDFGVFTGWCLFWFACIKITATCTQNLCRRTRHLCAMHIDGVADSNHAERRANLATDPPSTNTPLVADGRIGIARYVGPTYADRPTRCFRLGRFGTARCVRSSYDSDHRPWDFGTARCVVPPSVFSTFLIDDYGNDNAHTTDQCAGIATARWVTCAEADRRPPTNRLEKRHSSRSFGGMATRMCLRLASCTNTMSSARFHVQ